MSRAIRFPDKWPEFVDVAVELKLEERDTCFREVSFALAIASACAGARWQRLAVDANTVGLAPDVVGRIMTEWTERAKMMQDAHRIFRALVPHQPLILDLVRTTK